MTTTEAEIIWILILLGEGALLAISGIVLVRAVRDAGRLLRRWKETMR